MKLMTLHIQNFKRLKNLDLELNGKSTVFSGINGVGKSTVLSAINYLMWPALNRLNSAQGTAFRSLSADMVHTGQQLLHLSAEFALNGQTFALQRDYTAPQPGKPARSNNQKEMYDNFIGEFVSAYLSGQANANMPLFVTYGTNRSVLDIPLRIRNRHEFSQAAALERASESSLDFRTFFEWFRNQEDLENEIKSEKQDLSYRDTSLECVRAAVCAMLDGVSDLRVKRSPLRMTVNKDGAEFRVDDLSDGEKCTLALFGDLARRIAMANPHLANPLEGEGLVLIDEIELHMHPSWQRRILGALRTAFPNIQFIVTTHSPQVLSEVDANCNLFSLELAETGITAVPYTVYGWDSNGILNAAMETPSRPKPVAQAFRSFYAAVDSENFDDAQHILEQLRKVVAPDDPELTGCEVRLDLEMR